MHPFPAINSWIACSRPNARATLRLLCFPYAGGGGSPYLQWADFLPGTIEICTIQMPGRDARIVEPLVTRMETLIQTLAGAMESYGQIPYAFFGHSMGALVGFELARALRRRRRTGPVVLFASGCRAPQLPDPGSPIHGIDTPAFIAELRRLEGTPEEVLQSTELMELLLPALRADFALCETYVYEDEAPLDCAISVFGGLDDPRTTRAELESWRLQTRRSFRLHMFSGNHFFLQQAPLQIVQEVARDLQPFL